MARYTFTCEHFAYDDFTGDETNVSVKHTTQFRADDLTTMLENFESFLRGAGFHFDGVIDVVKPEEESVESEWDFSGIPQNNFPFISPISACESEEDIQLDFGAAQPTMNFDLDNNMNSSFMFTTNEIEERCSVCKLPKSVMAAERCYDKQCPKTNFFGDYDYKLASEK